ncbi:glycoside hydrolase family 74 protein [Apiospora kogelbergensis]|uniref:Glycoside hydrolase family 74 protein n=1 Tax=Apiospora kogelbergensis TaxID=1337665 RepID=A0AAW0QN41_9PEZI
MIEALEIDPHDSDHCLYGTGLTLFGDHDLANWDTASEKITIESFADGIEDTSVQDVVSAHAPGGSELLAATGDVGNPNWATNVGVDYAGKAVKHVVRIGNTVSTKQIAVSSDGGATWAKHPGADTVSTFRFFFKSS